jgi:hypothetical protein
MEFEISICETSIHIGEHLPDSCLEPAKLFTAAGVAVAKVLLRHLTQCSFKSLASAMLQKSWRSGSSISGRPSKYSKASDASHPPQLRLKAATKSGTCFAVAS